MYYSFSRLYTHKKFELFFFGLGSSWRAQAKNVKHLHHRICSNVKDNCYQPTPAPSFGFAQCTQVLAECQGSC